MASSRKPRGRVSPEARAAECACSYPYRDHRQERSQIATVCARCRCVGFTPRHQPTWNRLLRSR
jgi:hypothetical protein